MITWATAIERIKSAEAGDLEVHKSRFGGFGRIPVVVTGAPGAGKTQIWSRLTGNAPADQASMTTDDGYVITRKRNRKIALTTIPGQESRSRFYAMEELFGERTRVDGVIFVASNGFDHTWPKHANEVASSLPTFGFNTLLERNRKKELFSFRDVCDHVIQKKVMAPEEFMPRWLLVAVNKLDLYWNEQSRAREYYMRTAESDFAEIADDLLRRVGSMSLDYHVLPVAAGALNFSFDSDQGQLSAISKLSATQCDTSLAILTETVGELSGI